jgi:hypothetical protein
MDLVLSQVIHHLTGGRAPSSESTMPLTTVGPDETGPFTEELTISSIKKGGPSTNGSDLNKDNINKPTFDNLTKEDRKALEAYRKRWMSSSSHVMR